MKLNIDHATPSADKPLAHAVWDEPHDVVVPTHALGSISGSVSIDLTNGSVQTGALTGAVTFALPSVAANTTEHLTLILTNAGTHAITVTGAAWVSGAAPDLGNDCIIVLRGTSAGWIADGGIYA